ncbi:unnamed protein product [Orchesella dallaii]|uniref:Uncharacterized protein n=1 Tax=Orchesella dallaii TaxID=48710 RepID=A0ABP1Q3U5_9HEXA
MSYFILSLTNQPEKEDDDEQQQQDERGVVWHGNRASQKRMTMTERHLFGSLIFQLKVEICSISEEGSSEPAHHRDG